MKIMKRLLIIFILTFPTLGLTQEIDNSKKFTVGINTNVNIGYRKLSAQDTYFDWIIDSRNEREIPGFGYSSGINSELYLIKNLSIDVSILFESKNYKTEPIEGLFSDGTEVSLIFIYRHYYLSTPVKLNFTFLNQNKLSFYVAGGGSVNLFAYRRNKSIIKYIDKKNEVSKGTKAKDFNNYSISILAGLGINYDISELLRIKIEPILNYSNSPVKDAPIHESLQNAGLNFGLGFKIK